MRRKAVSSRTGILLIDFLIIDFFTSLLREYVTPRGVISIKSPKDIQSLSKKINILFFINIL